VKNELYGSGALIAIMALWAAPAAAQTTPPAPGGMEDIIVTARRSEENIQSTPISVTAFSGESLRQANVTSITDIMYKTPGVYLAGSGAKDNTNFQIRGQSKALSGSNAAAVVGYVSDVPQPSFGGGILAYDMASVQVLKGPQGTLFGRNTTGGAILFYPTAPNYDLGGYAEARYGRFDERHMEGAITLPIIDDHVAIRAAGYFNKHDPYTRNLGAGGDLDDDNARSFRLSLLLEPTIGIKNLTIFDYYKNYRTGDSMVATLLTDEPSLLDAIGVRAAAEAALAAQKARGRRVVDSDATPAFSHVRRLSLTNRTDVDITDDISLTNIFGYRRTFVRYNFNVDGLPTLVSAGVPTSGIPAGLPFYIINAGANNHVEQITNETQLKGSLFNDKVDWLLGAFYLHSNPYGPTGSGNTAGNPAIPGVDPSLATFAYNFYTEDSRAVFANVNIDAGSLVEGLRFSAGMRYTWDKERACTATDNVTRGLVDPEDCVASNPALINPTVNRAKSNAPTWTLGVDWQATPDLFAYLVTRRGYRAGGINTPTFGGTLAGLQNFGPERVTDVELGVRSDWHVGDIGIRLNASAFAGYYDGVQVVFSGVRTNPGCLVGDPVFGQAPYSPDGDCNPDNDPQTGTLLGNGGKSRVAGIDFDGRITASSRLTLTFGGNIMDTKTRSFDVPAVVAPYVADGRIPFNLVARQTYTAGLRYALPLKDDAELAFTGDYYHSSKQEFTTTDLPAYDLVNMRVDWNNVAGRPMDLSFYMTNVFDVDYQPVGSVAGSGLGFVAVAYGAPRQYGVSLRVRFGQQ
jgi:iron complex outermembrane receptor protein